MTSNYDSVPYETTWKVRWPCIWCREVIPAGETHWRYAGVWDGEKQLWGMHAECFAAFEVDCKLNLDGVIYPGEHVRGTCWPLWVQDRFGPLEPLDTKQQQA